MIALTPEPAQLRLTGMPSKKTRDDFALVFAGLKKILAAQTAGVVVTHNEPGHYSGSAGGACSEFGLCPGIVAAQSAAHHEFVYP